jgi:regulation of enolase protein 1 (concanavalin A-like superfamily)
MMETAHMTGFEQMGWLNEPRSVTNTGDMLVVRTKHATDFWHETFYGFRRHSGHFLHRKVAGEFTAEVTVSGKFEELYDQAGLMLRIDETHWVKTGIEFTDGAMHFSVVITDGLSDWSLFEWPEPTTEARIRLTRHRDGIRVHYRDGKGRWRPVRLGHLTWTEEAEVGIMCCSPEREGFEARFRNFHIGAPISRQLHD